MIQSRQLLLSLPPVTATQLIPITGDTSAESVVIEIRGEDVWSTSPFPLDHPVEFAVLMGKGVPIPESLAVRGTQRIEPSSRTTASF